MHEHSRATAVALAGLFLVGTIATPAMAADGTSTAEPDVSTPLPIVDDAFVETLQMLSDAGVNELDPQFSGVTVIDGSADDAVVVEYYADSPLAAELLEIVAAINRTSPMPIRAEAVSFDLAHLQELQLRLSDPDDPFLVSMGLTDTTGAGLDLSTGRLIAVNTNRDVVRRYADGLMFDGVHVDVAYDESGAARVEFQLGDDTGPSY